MGYNCIERRNWIKGHKSDDGKETGQQCAIEYEGNR